MEIDSVIVLEDGEKCELLDKVTYQENDYFLAETLDNESQPTENYSIIKASKENNEFYIEKEEDEKVLVEVLKLFTKNFAELIANIKEEDLTTEDNN